MIIYGPGYLGLECLKLVPNWRDGTDLVPGAAFTQDLDF